MKRSRIFVVLVALTIGAQAQAQNPVTVPGITAPVTIQQDAFGFPTITGATENDVAFAQGYLHARDRLFQMDLVRRQASGTLAELLGPTLIGSDVQLRTLGLRRAALATYNALDGETRGWLQAYANGVNRYLADNPLPPEYTLLELTRAEPWSALDSIVVGKALAFQLSFDLDIDLTIKAFAYQQAGAIGGFDGGALFAEDTHRVAPIDDRVSVPGFLEGIGGIGATPAGSGNAGTDGKRKDSGALRSGPTSTPPTAAPGRIAAHTERLAKNYRERIADIPILRRALSQREGRGGSNEWAVSAALSADGRPLVANDPHLGLDMPPVFAEEQIIISGDGGYEATGVSVPGAPGIIQGCNAHLCWGSTVNPMDVTDTFEETLVTNSIGLPTHTVFRGEAEPIVWIYQSYLVNNIGDEVPDNVTRAGIGYDGGALTFIVPRRNNGPLVEVDPANNFGLSVQYIGWGATFELVAFRDINRASSQDEFEAALQRFDVGSQNFIYADVEGNIGYYTSGEMPIRADLQDDMAPDGGIPPWLIRDGSGTLNHEWLTVRNPQPQQATPYELLPFGEMPQAVNPESGYLANANNDPIGTTLDNNALNQVRPGGGLYYLSPGYSSDRIGRIDRVLQELVARGDVTLDDMAALQANNQLLDAELLTPYLLEAVQNAAADGAWPGIAQFLLDPRVAEAAQRLAAWDFSTPTGIAEGYDPGDDPKNLPAPDQAEIDASVAATIFAAWRGQLIRNTVDATLGAIGLGSFLPGSTEAVRTVEHLLETFDTGKGVGASGIPFFNVPGVEVPTPEDSRDAVLLASLAQTLDLLASEEFAPAFDQSTDLSDYRWGKLHRIVFNHPLNVDPLNVPNGGGLSDLGPGLPGVARAGGRGAVDASSHGARADGLNEFRFGSGPARRFIGALGPDGVEGEQVIPGGRSGIFLSPYYADQLPLWLTNQYKVLTLGAAAADDTELFRIELVPPGP